MEIKVYDHPDGIGAIKLFGFGSWEDDLFKDFRSHHARITKDHQEEWGSDNLNEKSLAFADEAVQMEKVAAVGFNAWLMIEVEATNQNDWEDQSLQEEIKELIERHYKQSGTRWVTYPWQV